jgi:hypothetical protein
MKKAMTSKNLTVSSPSLQKQQTYSNAKRESVKTLDIISLTGLGMPLQRL